MKWNSTKHLVKMLVESTQWNQDFCVKAPIVYQISRRFFSKNLRISRFFLTSSVHQLYTFEFVNILTLT